MYNNKNNVYVYSFFAIHSIYTYPTFFVKTNSAHFALSAKYKLDAGH